jgi:hypothetical protein
MSLIAVNEVTSADERRSILLSWYELRDLILSELTGDRIWGGYGDRSYAFNLATKCKHEDAVFLVEKCEGDAAKFMSPQTLRSTDARSLCFFALFLARTDGIDWQQMIKSANMGFKKKEFCFIFFLFSKKLTDMLLQWCLSQKIYINLLFLINEWFVVKLVFPSHLTLLLGLFFCLFVGGK